jgi:hypothetical protein
MNGTVEILDASFLVSEATVLGSLIDEGSFFWYIDVRAEGPAPASAASAGEPSRWIVNPNTMNGGLAHPTGAPRNCSSLQWRDQSAYDSSTGDWVGSFYVFEHEKFEHSNVLVRREERGWSLLWEGVCDIGWDAKYGRDVPFTVRTSIDMQGIDVIEATESAARKALEASCDLSTFEKVVALDGRYRFLFR